MLYTVGDKTVSTSDGKITLKFSWEVLRQELETGTLNDVNELKYKLEIITKDVELLAATSPNDRGYYNAAYLKFVGSTLYNPDTVSAVSANTTKVLTEGTVISRDTVYNSLRAYYRAVWINEEGIENDEIIEFTDERVYLPSFYNYGCFIRIAQQTLTDEDVPTITYQYNVKPLTCQAAIALSDSTNTVEIPYRDIPIPRYSKTDTTYSFNFTEEEKAIIYAKLFESKRIPITFIIASTLNESINARYLDIFKAELILVNYKPVIVPIVKDINERTLRVTGDENTLVRYFSNAYFKTGAQAVKGATLSTQYVKNGDVLVANTPEGTIEGVASNTFYFSATDNRDYTTRDAVVKTLIPYIKLTCNVATEEMTANGDLTVMVSGKYYNGSFGKMNNSLELEYALAENEGDIIWYPLGVINPEVDEEGNYYYEYTIRGLNHESRYTLIVNAIDEVMPQPSTAYKVVATIPVFDWGENDFKHYTDVFIANGKNIKTTTDSGVNVNVLGTTAIGSVALGYGNYAQGSGHTTIYGNEVNILTKNKFKINGTAFGESQILWEGASHMNGNQTAPLSQAISAQSHGIVLVFSLYREGAAADVSFNTFYISKKEVELLPGSPHTFIMGINAGFSTIGAKYLTINDTSIVGNATNTSSGNNSGITFNNSSFVLRYVIGV